MCAPLRIVAVRSGRPLGSLYETEGKAAKLRAHPSPGQTASENPELKLSGASKIGQIVYQFEPRPGTIL